MLAALSAAPAAARLGETYAQCNERYDTILESGTLDDRGAGYINYTKNGLSIRVHFFNGVADWIEYSPGDVHGIDFEAAEYLARINGGPRKWLVYVSEEEAPVARTEKRREENMRRGLVKWVTDDGKIMAMFNRGKRTLTLYTSFYNLRKHELLLDGL